MDQATLTELQRGYMILVFLESTTAVVDELAAKLRAEEIDSLEAGLTLWVLAAIVGPVKEALEGDPPVKKLERAWAEGEQAVVILASIFADWFDQKITSEDIPGRIALVNEHIDRALDLAGKQMIKEYGVTKAQLDEARSQAQEEFKSILEKEPSQ